MNEKTCPCGSTRLQAVQYTRASGIGLIPLDKSPSWSTPNIPEPYVCMDCGRVSLYMSEKALEKFS